MKHTRCSAQRSGALVLGSVALLALSACSDDNEILETSSLMPTDPAPAAGESTEPTFYQDVGPIFSSKCTGCHQEGGIAPFALNDYEAARSRGAQIADYTENRIMPPYGIETGGACGSFDESRTLSLEEIALIGRWGRGERAEGSVAPLMPPVLPTLEGGTDFSLPQFTPQIVGSQIAQFDEYRCFLVEPNLTELAFITGYDVVPGNKQIVHHVLGFLVDPEFVTPDGRTNAAVMQGLHDADPNPEREGWACYGAAGDGVEVEAAPVTWGPGQGVVNYSNGVGVPVAPGRKLVVQVHYNLADSANVGQTDQTRVRLRLAPSAQRPAVFLLEDPLLGSLYRGAPTPLAAGQESVKYVWEKTGADMGLPPGVPAQMIAIVPHMHERGRKYTLEVDNGAGFECQGRIGRWDFNWQHMYDYAAPLPFSADTRVRVTCDYDTSGATEPVQPGWGTRNEMCLAMIMLALPAGL